MIQKQNRKEARIKRHHRIRAQQTRAGGVQLLQVTSIRHDEYSAPAGRRDAGRSLGHPRRPVLPRQRLPDGVRHPARD